MKELITDMTKSKPRLTFFLVFILALVLMPVVMRGDTGLLPMHLVIVVAIYIVLGVSWNLMAGVTGLFSLGHAAFYGIGGYSVGVFVNKLRMPPSWGVLMGVLLCVLFAIVIGAVSSKLSGFYFTMATVALGEVIKTIAIQWVQVTNSNNGLAVKRPNIPRPFFFYAALLLVALALLAFYLIRRSRIGSMFVSIRENSNLAQTLGVSITKYKTLATIISATMASLAGSFMAYYTQVVDPNYLSSTVSNKIIIVVIIGGMGSLFGPLLGSFVILLEELMRGILGANYAPLTIILYSIILIVFILIKPSGMIGIRFASSKKNLLKSVTPD